MRHILVATDFSETANEALRQAVKLAAPQGARLTLLHVIYADKLTETLLGLDAMEYLTRIVGEGATPEQGVEFLENSARDKLAAAVDGLIGPRPPIETAVVDGRPSEEILKYAGEHGVDLIVVGTHGRGALGKALLGSVADHVIRQAACPVLVVRGG
jgi:nucleotide-binding universal stress UspA family protein